MSVPDVLNAPWALLPEKHAELCAVYERHLNGVTLDAETMKAGDRSAAQRRRL